MTKIKKQILELLNGMMEDAKKGDVASVRKKNKEFTKILESLKKKKGLKLEESEAPERARDVILAYSSAMLNRQDLEYTRDEKAIEQAERQLQKAEQEINHWLEKTVFWLRDNL